MIKKAEISETEQAIKFITINLISYVCKDQGLVWILSKVVLVHAMGEGQTLHRQTDSASNGVTARSWATPSTAYTNERGVLFRWLMRQCLVPWNRPAVASRSQRWWPRWRG